MGRSYAGVLGLLAFLATIARGVCHRGSLESTVSQAVFSLIVFAIVGAATGWLAGWIIDDSVRGQLATEMAALAKAKTEAAATAVKKK